VWVPFVWYDQDDEKQDGIITSALPSKKRVSEAPPKELARPKKTKTPPPPQQQSQQQQQQQPPKKPKPHPKQPKPHAPHQLKPKPEPLEQKAQVPRGRKQCLVLPPAGLCGCESRWDGPPLLLRRAWKR
jgi:hypothetical protein